jgi:predicted nucleic acid-binding protein
MNRFIADASIIVKMFFQEEYSVESASLVVNAREILAPDFLFTEVANVMWKRMKRDAIALETVKGMLDDALKMNVVARSTTELLPAAFQLATETGRTVYDCTYLALAIRENCPLVTADQRFFNALKPSHFGAHVRLVSDPAR